jgi:uncharacterized protein YecT (DUF1311 family)
MKFVKIMVCAVFGGLLWAGFASAQDVCANAQNTIEINQCLRAEYQRADAELNATYKQVLVENPELKIVLRDAQRAWIVFRDSECAVVLKQWEGGTGATGAHLVCMIVKTDTRSQQLKNSYLSF